MFVSEELTANKRLKEETQEQFRPLYGVDKGAACFLYGLISVRSIAAALWDCQATGRDTKLCDAD